jgi:hypothetical protein
MWWGLGLAVLEGPWTERRPIVLFFEWLCWMFGRLHFSVMIAMAKLRTTLLI